jgi:hypothetical protein
MQFSKLFLCLLILFSLVGCNTTSAPVSNKAISAETTMLINV